MSMMDTVSDWLLVDRCRLEGKENSLFYLMDMRLCGQLANAIRETADYDVNCENMNRRWVKVTIERVRDGVSLSWCLVDRDWPYHGLKSCMKMLKAFKNGKVEDE